LRSFCASLLSFFVPLAAHSQAQTVRIGVLGIFHPQQLTLAPAQDETLVISAADKQIFLQPRSACSLLRIRLVGDALLLGCNQQEIRATELRITNRNQQAAIFFLGIPGKIKRRYQGILEVKAKNGELIPVVAMDLETAVASAVQAETIPGTPLEALKAQAVVSRSYFSSGGGRHAGFDFCDLTHCQFLRDPPPADSPAAMATAATRGLVLTYNGKAVSAMFSRSCGGHTRTPQELVLPQPAYPYFSVLCDSCYKNPVRWTRNVSPEDAVLLRARGENGRLAVCRRLGWNAVPSNNFSAHQQGGEIILHGVGQGHGIGLCQRGARAMAEQGSDFHAILNHYFPNTGLEDLHPAP
jgi:stage II sporulation protein D